MIFAKTATLLCMAGVVRPYPNQRGTFSLRREPLPANMDADNNNGSWEKEDEELGEVNTDYSVEEDGRNRTSITGNRKKHAFNQFLLLVLEN